MRALLILALVGAVGGCASTRHALGLYKNAADKGVTVGGGGGEGTAPPGSASSEEAPAPAGKRGRASKQAVKVEQLPTGLAGDKEHHAYTDTPN